MCLADYGFCKVSAEPDPPLFRDDSAILMMASCPVEFQGIICFKLKKILISKCLFINGCVFVFFFFCLLWMVVQLTYVLSYYFRSAVYQN